MTEESESLNNNLCLINSDIYGLLKNKECFECLSFLFGNLIRAEESIDYKYEIVMKSVIEEFIDKHYTEDYSIKSEEEFEKSLNEMSVLLSKIFETLTPKEVTQ